MGEAGVVDARAPGLRVLGQVAELVGAQHDPAGRRRLARDDLEHRGLAGAVAADEPDLVAGAQLERGTLEGDPAADLDSEVADLQARPMVPRPAPGAPVGLRCPYRGLSWVTGR